MCVICICNRGRHNLNAKCNCGSMPVLVIECTFAAESERKHFVVKDKRRQPVHQVQLFQKWGGGGNANWIVFASTMAKLDLLLGVCLLLETFYGYSKLTC